MRLQLLALTILLALAVGGSLEASVRIMPVGDSITAGVTDAPDWTIPFTFSYRGPLYTLLTDAGYDFEFVGLSGEPWVYPTTFGQPTIIQGPDLRTVGQDGNRGYAGASVHDILAGGIVNGINNPIPDIVTALNADSPDIVLLMIGTNGFDPGGELDPLVNTIVTTKPDAQLIIAQIPPRVSNAAATLTYNNYIKNTLVPKYQSLGKNVTTVDQYPNFMNTDGTVNASLFENTYGTHIRPAGNELMAQTWYDGIMALSGIDPEPRPVVTGTYTEGNAPPALPTNNLILQGSDTLSDSFAGGGDPTVWSVTLPDSMNNGVMTDANVQPLLAWDGLTDNFGWAVYEFDTSTNTAGYDISEILSYAGWTGARVNQAVEIKYALVGETITEGEELGHTLGSFYYAPSDNSTPYAYTTMSIANSDDSAMLSGILAIEVKYIDNMFKGTYPASVTEPGNYTAYKQLAVIGTPTVADIPGDANRDGKVDGSDVTILAGNWQAGVGAPDPSTITWEMGDFNNDGQIDGSDVTILAGNWQAGVDAAAASVPEPCSIILLVMAALSLLIARRKS